MKRAITVYALLAVLGVVSLGSYALGRADRASGTERTLTPALHATDGKTFVGLEAGTVLPQDPQEAKPRHHSTTLRSASSRCPN